MALIRMSIKDFCFSSLVVVVPIDIRITHIFTILDNNDQPQRSNKDNQTYYLGSQGFLSLIFTRKIVGIGDKELRCNGSSMLSVTVELECSCRIQRLPLLLFFAMIKVGYDQHLLESLLRLAFGHYFPADL